jgi:hypothetical protein
LFMLVWLTMWTLGGCWAIFMFLWTLAGRDVLEVDAMSVKLRREIFGIGRTREYLGEAFRNLRVSPFDGSWYGGSRRRGMGAYTWMFEGPLTFDYGAKTYRFGGVDEAEAQQIVQRIGERYPQYVRQGGSGG